MSFPSLSDEMDPWADFTKPMSLIEHKRTSTALIKTALQLFRDTDRFLKDIEKYANLHGNNFEYIWTRVRAFIPLQLRLTAEQIFWDRGGGWRRYISGFSPIKGGLRSSVDARDKPTSKPKEAFGAGRRAQATVPTRSDGTVDWRKLRMISKELESQRRS